MGGKRKNEKVWEKKWGGDIEGRGEESLFLNRLLELNVSWEMRDKRWKNQKKGGEKDAYIAEQAEVVKK